MAQTLNINQEKLVPVPGEIDIHTMESGLITVMVDSTQATALKAGSFVKFVTTNTGPYPKVVAAGQNDVAHGVIPYVVKNAQFVAGDKMEIMFWGGNVIWMQATAVAITPGTQVESDATGLLVQASSGNKIRGLALDYFPASGMGRIIQFPIAIAAA